MIPEMEALRALAKTGLRNADRLLWTVQGFGMLRTYLDDAKRFRLHVWTQALKTHDVSTHHDHPWHFRSFVLAGRLYNTRYVETEGHDDRGERFWQQKIQCGECGGPKAEPEEVFLRRCVTETYHPGDVYSQRANEVHSTHYVDGTVSLVDRAMLEDPDHAFVFWPWDKQWVTAKPRAARDHEVREAVARALEGWDNQ